MDMTQHQINQKQYKSKSKAYLESTVHAKGEEFKKIIDVCHQHKVQKVLDLGCGGGHVSYHVADVAKEVVAYDLTEEMLSTVEQEAKLRQLKNIKTVLGAAEQLPFSDQSFDCVISRYSAHHWQDIKAAINEIYRVLKSNGIVIFVDVLGHQKYNLDTFLQSIELIRDPSHVRNYTISQWAAFIESAGFQLKQLERQKLKINFNAWVERMHTAPNEISTLLYLQKNCSSEVRNHYLIEEDGSFTSDVIYMVAQK